MPSPVLLAVGFFVCSFDFGWVFFLGGIFLQFHTCIPCIIDTLTPTSQSFLLTVSHLSLFILFCDPPRLTRAICETVGLELHVGAWWAQQKRHK